MRARRERGETRGMKWIAVVDGKPEDGQDVLAAHDADLWMDVLQWLEQDGIWLDPLDGEPIMDGDAPTHWMALPGLPKDDH